MRRLTIVILVLLVVTLAGIGPSLARQAVPTPRGQLGGPAPLATEPPPTPPTVSPTPAETGTPAATPASQDMPRPDECTVEPRSLDEIAQLAGHLAGTPRSVERTDGLTPDPVTVGAIRQTIREYIACLNAGDLLRAAALSTDPHAVELIATSGETPGLAARATPMPRPEAEWIAIVAIEDVFLQTERQASAIVVLDEPTALGARTLVRYLIYLAREDERWLIDAVLLGPSE
jgi:hypothetical protein